MQQRSNLFSTSNNSSITPRSIDILVEFINGAYLNEGQFRSLSSDDRENKVNEAYLNFTIKMTGLTPGEQYALKNETIPLEPSKTINSVLNECVQGCFRERCFYLARVVLAHRPDNHQIQSEELITRTKKGATTGQVKGAN